MTTSSATLIRVGSRESELAQAQSRHVMALLKEQFPDCDCSLTTFKTTGDLNQESKLSEMGEKGLFTKELELALLENSIDIAVHSMKDMPGELPEGLVLESAGLREDPRDVLISKNNLSLEALSAGAIVGTSSTRRIAMLKRCRPDLVCENIRGNLQTRLRKLKEGQYDAIILAAAGVHRLGWQERISQYLDSEEKFIPAPCQGILAVEYRLGDDETKEKLQAIQDPKTQLVMTAERAVLIQLEAGCHTPLGVYAKPINDENKLDLRIILLSPDGKEVSIQKMLMPFEGAESKAKKLAQEVLETSPLIV